MAGKTAGMGRAVRAAAVALGLALGVAQAAAQDAGDAAGGPVVVELFTSQGCAACPPADEMMHRLAARPDVIALALHVDYWDYIGWADVFARPEHAERQRGYARRAGKRMVYTPQMVIDGNDFVVGHKAMEISETVMHHKERPNRVAVTLTRSGARVLIEAEGRVAAPVEVHLVRFDPLRTVEITRGENRGRTIDYANVVREWRLVTVWDGAGPLQVEASAEGPSPLAVLVQQPDHGAILGAAALR